VTGQLQTLTAIHQYQWNLFMVKRGNNAKALLFSAATAIISYFNLGGVQQHQQGTDNSNCSSTSMLTQQ
jgi:hypothetical protein